MSYEFFIGLRYLKARRRHRSFSLNTIVSISGVTLGVGALIATLGIMTGFTDDIRNKILGTNAHIIVVDRTGQPMTDYPVILDKVRATPHVVAATPFLYTQVLLSHDRQSQGVVLRGVDPATAGRVTDLDKNLLGGSLADLATRGKNGEPGIILGKELAGRLGAFLGSSVTAISPTGDIGPMGIVPKLKKFTVVGIFDSGMYEYDSSLAYIPLGEAQKLLDYGDAVNGIEVKVDDIFRSGQIARDITARLDFPYGARDWKEMNKSLFSALQLEKIMMFIILVLIILVASFNIVSTLTMIVVEKGREIAILKAMGATPPKIMRIFMVEGLVIGLAGVALGIPLGYLASWLIQEFYTLPGDVYYISRIPVKLLWTDVASVSIAALAISLFATIYPSWRASKLEPVEALRYE
ncbi:MAG TPA: lipoprotein-releasing ABC transporter permease subunit [Nitrospiria bacterium]|nr:lipoprotein-releasing ABC transporter permease subunit [Nitrospiria bacterium]